MQPIKWYCDFLSGNIDYLLCRVIAQDCLSFIIYITIYDIAFVL